MLPVHFFRWLSALLAAGIPSPRTAVSRHHREALKQPRAFSRSGRGGSFATWSCSCGVPGLWGLFAGVGPCGLALRGVRPRKGLKFGVRSRRRWEGAAVLLRQVGCGGLSWEITRGRRVLHGDLTVSEGLCLLERWSSLGSRRGSSLPSKRNISQETLLLRPLGPRRPNTAELVVKYGVWTGLLHVRLILPEVCTARAVDDGLQVMLSAYLLVPCLLRRLGGASLRRRLPSSSQRVVRRRMSPTTRSSRGRWGQGDTAGGAAPLGRAPRGMVLPPFLSHSPGEHPSRCAGAAAAWGHRCGTAVGGVGVETFYKVVSAGKHRFVFFIPSP